MIRLRRSLYCAIVAWLVVTAGCGGSPNQPTDSTLPPVITCPSDVTMSSTGGPIVVPFPAPSVQNGSQPVTTTCQPVSSSTFSPGSTSVRCLAVDAGSRSAACAFTVTVKVEAPPPQLSVTQFVAFGDSITEGKVTLTAIGPLVDFPGSYPSTLRTLLPARYTTQQFVVTSSAIGGETAFEGKSRLPGVLSDTHPQVLLLQEGANDLSGGDASQVPVAVSSLQSMVQEARGRGVQVLIGTLLPQRAGAPSAGGEALVTPANNQIRTMASAQNATLVDLYAAFAGKVDSLIGPDGLHPTPAGYDLIAHTFFDAIQQRFEINPAPLSMLPARAVPH